MPLTEMKESLLRIPPPSCGLLIILHSPDRPLNTAICGGAEYLCGIICCASWLAGVAGAGAPVAAVRIGMIVGVLGRVSWGGGGGEVASS